MMRRSQPARTGIRVLRLQSNRSNDDRQSEINELRELMEEDQIDVEVEANNIDIDKLRKKIFEGAGKQNNQPIGSALPQQAGTYLPQQGSPIDNKSIKPIPVKMLADQNKQSTSNRETTKIGEPIRLPDPLRMNQQQQSNSSNSAYQSSKRINLQSTSFSPTMPEQSNLVSNRPNVNIQMPNIHNAVEPQNAQIQTLQGFVRQPQQYTQLNEGKGRQLQPKLQQSFAQYARKNPQTNINQNQISTFQYQYQPQQKPGQSIQPLQNSQNQYPRQQSIQDQIQQQQLQHQQSINSLPMQSSNPMQLSHPPTAGLIKSQQQAAPPSGMLISLRDPQITTQRVSEEVDTQLIKRVGDMQRQIEQLTLMLEEKQKREQLNHQHLEDIIRVKDTQLQRKDAQISKYLLKVEQMRHYSEIKAKQMDSLKYQLARQKQRTRSTSLYDPQSQLDMIDRYKQTTSSQSNTSHEFQIRRQQQQLDDIERSHGDTFLRQHHLFKRVNKQTQQQSFKPHQQRYSSEFEVKWNSNEWNLDKHINQQQQYLSPLTVNMSGKRPYEIDDSKRFRFDDLQDMSDLDFP